MVLNQVLMEQLKSLAEVGLIEFDSNRFHFITTEIGGLVSLKWYNKCSDIEMLFFMTSSTTFWLNPNSIPKRDSKRKLVNKSGKSLSRYYVMFETMKQFATLNAEASLQDILFNVAGMCHKYSIWRRWCLSMQVIVFKNSLIPNIHPTRSNWIRTLDTAPKRKVAH